MLRIFTRHFSKATPSKLREAELKRTRGLIQIYRKPFEELKTDEERLKLAYSGKVWLSHADLQSRPRKISPEIYERPREVDSLKDRLNISQIDLNKNEIWIPFRTAFTHHSTAIEGNSLSLEQTKLVLDTYASDKEPSNLHSEDTDLDLNGQKLLMRDVQEVLDHAKAMEYLRSHVVQKESIEEDDIIAINHTLCPANKLSIDIILKGLAVTKYRELPVKVYGSPAVRPYPHEVPAVMKELLRIHNEKVVNLHPLISAAQFHANFLWVHPFLDGNG